jgi:hypothetical protein
MTGRFDDDEVLALDLVEALREARPLVDEVAERAKGAFTWRTIDEDLLAAQLRFDSAEQAAPSLTRGAEGGRVMVFSADLRSVDRSLVVPCA